MNPILQLSFFGGLRLQISDQLIRSVKTERLQSLLVYLVLNHDRPQDRAHLAMLRTPDRPEAEAKKRLNRALYDLRGALASVEPLIGLEQLILADEFSVQWIGNAFMDLDVFTFESHLRMVTDGTTSPLQAAQLAHLEQAVMLYKGDLLPHLYDDWLVPLREHYYQLMKAALLQLSEQYEELGKVEQALRTAEQLVRLARTHDDPDERAHQQLLCLAGRARNRVLVERTYYQLSQWSFEMAETPPSDEATALYHEMLALTTHPSPQRNLPQPLTPFVGRQRELLEIAHRLQTPECRLLTLTGLIGVGKSRLAIQSANQLTGFAHGIRYVDLQEIHSTTALTELICEAIGESSVPIRATRSAKPEGWLRASNLQFSATSTAEQNCAISGLHAKSVLLVLDHAELLRTSPAAATWITQLLGEVSGLKILATARRRLGIRGEQALHVGGLDEAIELLLQTVAHLSHHSSWLDPTEQLHAAKLCLLLDNNPLAIEVAAQWAAFLTLPQMIEEIQHEPEILFNPGAERFSSYAPLGDRYGEIRQSLNPQEQEVLTALMALGDSFDRHAIRRVPGASLPLVNALLEQALLSKSGDSFQVPHLVRYAFSRRVSVGRF